MVSPSQAVQHTKSTHSALAFRNASNPKMGNQVVQRLLQDGVIQAKLTVNQPGDRFEQEADQVANEVMRMPDSQGTRRPPQIQRLCTKCEEDLHRVEIEQEEEENILQAKAAPGHTPEVSPKIETYIEGIRGGGQQLPNSVRDFFEPRFGHDLSQVRVHTDTAAARTARAVEARAYTVGRSIVFGAGEFRPETNEGRSLLAHEITHTIQQGHGSSTSGQQVQRTINDGHDLQATRFIIPSRNLKLEEAYDPGDHVVIKKPDNGPHVRLLQESLLAMGYTLPAFGADGDFGDETEAAIIQFQMDAGATLKDGIVGPETMELFDKHDTTRGGVGPPQRKGPVPSPLPPPAAGCDSRYTGVSFTPTNKVVSDEDETVDFVIKRDMITNDVFLDIRGKKPAKYTLDVTITAPSNAKAQEFEVGFASNILTVKMENTYSNGGRVYSDFKSLPIKDGKGLSKNDYDPVYTRASGVQSFTANGQKISLVWGDKPIAFALRRWLANPQCAGVGRTDGRLTQAEVQHSFRTWVVVRHKASGCTLALHHIDWNTNWIATVPIIGREPTPNVVSDTISVTQDNGNGKPPFIQGGQVFNDLVRASLVCQ
jgi:peptidoglycan hydrolase-like protein with peptidoglycan-binding domain